MEVGFVQAEGPLYYPATILWFRTNPEEVVGKEVAPMPAWLFSASPRFAGFRCESCGILEVDYKSQVGKS